MFRLLIVRWGVYLCSCTKFVGGELLYDLDFEGGEGKIFRGCVDKIGEGGKPERLDNLGDSTV